MRVTHRGERVELAALAREHGIDLRTLKSRLDRGLSMDEALTTPRRRYPSGVLRPREPQHEGDIPLCDRCGEDRKLGPVFGGVWTLCERCRHQLSAITASWVNGG